ncbi:response regulator [Halorussus sp. MSC15.2]|uniref:hybrid sensor histidine kinase/response regulator n=1 Tax=Halorussus sp. MSC15.2 TaxID=2283638 RepID=UPI0013D612FB|nr:response regulator [Halorussus sp. MSC15.2]NEU58308.1 response regulator [Halorussus sp. MSC15.2]
MPEAHPRVLHVEDNDFFAKVTSGILADEYDIDVFTVESAEAALERLETNRFDCIVSDYDMPGMDGLELLDAVRETDRDVPFILLTGGGSEQIASKAISAGVTDYLKKGTDQEQFAVLANRIENAVSRRRAERLANRQIAVNDLIWDVSQAILQASSREDIEQIVCERLADSGPYLLAWVGTVDEETASVRPEASAGVEQRYLDTVILDGDREEGDSVPVRKAVETQKVQVKRGARLKERFQNEVDANVERYAVAAVPLVYENRAYGVLSVWSDVRHAFGETERRVLSKFGNNLAYAIDSVQTRKELVRREQRLQVFNRILRHNLRNDLNVVLGRAENIAEEFPPAANEASIIRQKASELIEISEKAREVGKTLDGENRATKQIDVTDCVKRTCEEFRQSYPDVAITTDTPQSAVVYGDKTLEAAISEIVENAIEHGGDRPSVSVTVSASGDDEWVEVTVLDDGPGIPEEERKVLAEGEETALHHGSGLGLWLSNWIVGKFGGDLTFDDYHTNGGEVTLRLQQATEGVSPWQDISPLEYE